MAREGVRIVAEPRSTSARKREASRRAILDATAEIVAEKGIDGFTISEVAKRAGINRALVYHYFANRDNLIVQTINHIVDRYEPFPPGAAIDEAAVERAVRLQIENPVLPRFFFQTLLNQRPLPSDLPRIRRVIETLEEMRARSGVATLDSTFAVAIFTLIVLSWAIAREDIARILNITVAEADARLIRQLKQVVELELRALQAGGGGGEAQLAAE